MLLGEQRREREQKKSRHATPLASRRALRRRSRNGVCSDDDGDRGDGDRSGRSEQRASDAQNKYAAAMAARRKIFAIAVSRGVLHALSGGTRTQNGAFAAHASIRRLAIPQYERADTSGARASFAIGLQSPPPSLSLPPAARCNNGDDREHARASKISKRQRRASA